MSLHESIAEAALEWFGVLGYAPSEPSAALELRVAEPETL
jgi:hypothetical protein